MRAIMIRNAGVISLVLWAILAAVLIALAGCATAPEPKVVTKVVQVPVSKPCVPADVPAPPKAYADDGLSPDATPDQRYLAIASANQARKSRLLRIEPVLDGCRR